MRPFEVHGKIPVRLVVKPIPDTIVCYQVIVQYEDRYEHIIADNCFPEDANDLTLILAEKLNIPRLLGPDVVFHAE